MTNESDLLDRARNVRKKYRERLMTIPHVVGLGVGFRVVNGAQTNTIAVVVMVDKKIPPALLPPEHTIPSELDGIPVDVQEVGFLRAN